MSIDVSTLLAAVQDGAHDHFGWCLNHDYENETDPDVQLCRALHPLSFPAWLGDRDEVSSISVELTGSRSDVEHGFPVPQASVGFNGQPGQREMAPWKLRPFAFLLLAADAQARGDKSMARAFTDAAQAAITAHCIEVEPEPVVSEQPRHWSQGPFAYVQGGDPDAPLIPWDTYQAAKQQPVPAFIVAHTGPGHCEVQAVGAGKSADGHDYDCFEAAKRAAAVLNAAKAVFDAAPVPHHYDQTQPHPRAVHDAALNLFGIDATDEEIAAAVRVVMA